MSYYSDPMRDQIRQQQRAQRLQLLAGLEPASAPVAASAPEQPHTDYARMLTGTVGGGIGWGAGAALAGRALAMVPHPVPKIAGMAITAGIPLVASALGSGLATQGVDTVAPGAHEALNHGLAATGPIAPLAGAGLAAYALMRGRRPAANPVAGVPHLDLHGGTFGAPVDLLGMLGKGHAPPVPPPVTPVVTPPVTTLAMRKVPDPGVYMGVGHPPSPMPGGMPEAPVRGMLPGQIANLLGPAHPIGLPEHPSVRVVPQVIRPVPVEAPIRGYLPSPSLESRFGNPADYTPVHSLHPSQMSPGQLASVALHHNSADAMTQAAIHDARVAGMSPATLHQPTPAVHPVEPVPVFSLKKKAGVDVVEPLPSPPKLRSVDDGKGIRFEEIGRAVEQHGFENAAERFNALAKAEGRPPLTEHEHGYLQVRASRANQAAPVKPAVQAPAPVVSTAGSGLNEKHRGLFEALASGIDRDLAGHSELKDRAAAARGILRHEPKVVQQALMEHLRQTAPDVHEHLLARKAAKVAAAPETVPVPEPRAETIPGTRAVAERYVNAENRFIESAAEQFGISPEDAAKVLRVYRDANIVKIDPVVGQFSLKHGAFWEKPQIEAALAKANAGKGAPNAIGQVGQQAVGEQQHPHGNGGGETTAPGGGNRVVGPAEGAGQAANPPHAEAQAAGSVLKHPYYLEDLTPSQQAALDADAISHMPSRERGDLKKIWQKSQAEAVGEVRGHLMSDKSRMSDEAITAAKERATKQIQKGMRTDEGIQVHRLNGQYAVAVRGKTEVQGLSADKARKYARGLVESHYDPSETEAASKSRQAVLHERNVKAALDAGLPVPPEALADYPHLTKSPAPAPAPAAWHADRENVFEAMRKIGDENEREWQRARDLSPRGASMSVGSADFDHTLKATVGDEYLRTIRKGGTPEDAMKSAIAAGSDAVKKWNEGASAGRATMAGAHELKRWEGAGQSAAELIHRKFMAAMEPPAPKVAAPAPASANPLPANVVAAAAKAKIPADVISERDGRYVTLVGSSQKGEEYRDVLTGERITVPSTKPMMGIANESDVPLSVLAKQHTPVAPLADYTDLLKQAAPYQEYGPDYNRNIATSASQLQALIERGHSPNMQQLAAEELQLRLGVHGKKPAVAKPESPPIQPSVDRAAELRSAITAQGGPDANSVNDIEAIRKSMWGKHGTGTPTPKEVRDAMDQMRVESSPEASPVIERLTPHAEHPPHRDFRYTPTVGVKNSGQIVPNRPGEKFTDQQVTEIKTWLEGRGMTVKSAGPTKIDVTDPSGARLDLALHGAQGVKRESQAAAATAAKQLETERKAAMAAAADGRDSSGWIKSTFGESSMNAFNQTKLADFIEGKTKTFDGMVNSQWEDGLKQIGALHHNGRVDWKAVRKAYEEAAPKPAGQMRLSPKPGTVSPGGAVLGGQEYVPITADRKALADKVIAAKSRAEVETLIGPEATERYYRMLVGGSDKPTSLVSAMQWKSHATPEAARQASPAPVTQAEPLVAPEPVAARPAGVPEYVRRTPSATAGAAERAERRQQIQDLEFKTREAERQYALLNNDLSKIPRSHSKKRRELEEKIEKFRTEAQPLRERQRELTYQQDKALIEDALENPKSHEHYLKSMSELHDLERNRLHRMTDTTPKVRELGRDKVDAISKRASEHQQESDRHALELIDRIKAKVPTDKLNKDEIQSVAEDVYRDFSDRSDLDRSIAASVERRLGHRQQYGQTDIDNLPHLTPEQKLEFKKDLDKASEHGPDWFEKSQEVIAKAKGENDRLQEVSRQEAKSAAEEKARLAEIAAGEALKEGRARNRERLSGPRYIEDVDRRAKLMKGAIEKVGEGSVAADRPGVVDIERINPTWEVVQSLTRNDKSGKLEKEFALKHTPSGLNAVTTKNAKDAKSFLTMAQDQGIDLSGYKTGEEIPKEVSQKLGRVQRAWNNGDIGHLDPDELTTAIGKVTKPPTSIQADMVLGADDLGYGHEGKTHIAAAKINPKLQELAAAVPEFGYNPVLTVSPSKKLVFRDGYKYEFSPESFNLHPNELTPGQTIGVNLDEMGIKRPSESEVVAGMFKQAGWHNVTANKAGGVSASFEPGSPKVMMSADRDNPHKWFATGAKGSEDAQKLLSEIRWKQPGQDSPLRSGAGTKSAKPTTYDEQSFAYPQMKPTGLTPTTLERFNKSPLKAVRDGDRVTVTTPDGKSETMTFDRYKSNLSSIEQSHNAYPALIDKATLDSAPKIGRLSPKAESEGKPAPKNMAGETRPKRAAKAAPPKIESLHPKAIDKFNAAFEAKDPAMLKEVLHLNNKGLRAEFEKRTGLKLPKTVKGTNQLIDTFAAGGSGPSIERLTPKGD